MGWRSWNAGPGQVRGPHDRRAANPYLAAAVLLASGLDGIDRELDSGDPNDGNMYETSPEELERCGIELLPSNLLDAIRSLRRDELLREALGRTSKGAYLDSSAM